jgi:hypothetical protein
MATTLEDARTQAVLQRRLQPTIDVAEAESTGIAIETSGNESASLSARDLRVNLTRLKSLASKMGSRHPLRILLLAEPDEIPWEEYATKSAMWFRLLKLKED